jgi:hypothetical protein
MATCGFPAAGTGEVPLDAKGLTVVATAGEIPLDAKGLPHWQVREFLDFPVRIELPDPEALARLLDEVPIADFHREQIRVAGPGVRRLVFEPRVTEAEARALTDAGYSWVRIHDAEQEVRREMERVWAEQARAGGDRLLFGEKTEYHTYTQIGAILQQTAIDHPSIARFESMGTSVLGRELWMIVLSDNVTIEEAEAEVRLSSTMHGNEPPGLEMLLYLVEHLTDSYGIDPDVTNLVDNYEIHILPCHNPDGLVAGTRRNANGIDLNRNFPVPDGTIGDDGTWVEETETVLFKDYGLAHNFVISENGHSGALVVNYPWDYKAELAPDNDAIVQLSLEYSTYNLPMYNGRFPQGITNGYAWYQVKGSLQDWSYHETGGIDVTIEYSNSFVPPASQLPQLWEENRESFMHFIKAARYGVNGIVTGSDGGQPLAATISVAGNEKPVVTDPDHGDYYKLLDTGTHDLTFSASGYLPRTITGVSTVWGTPTVLDVVLDRAPQGVVAGRVRSVLGGGLDAGIEIRTHPGGVLVTTVQSDGANEGAYSVALDYGDYLFRVTSAGHVPASRIVVVDEPAETQDFLLGVAENVILFADDFEAGTGQWTGGWDLSTDHHSPTHSMTDSPGGDYPDGVTNPCTMVFDVDPSQVAEGSVSFWAHWDIEPNWDCCLFQVSTNGGAGWQGVATSYTVPGSGQGAQPLGVPVFEGLQASWVENLVDLSPWLGEPSIRFRFVLLSDSSLHRDGFYLDDFKIEGIQVVTAVDQPVSVTDASVPCRLLRNYANPFEPMGQLRFETGRAGPVTLAVYDVRGRLVRLLVPGEVLPAGEHATTWDGRSTGGRVAPSGLYFLRLRVASADNDVSRLVLVR